MNRFWMSWYEPLEDYRPMTYPPNEAVLGWWCTGYNDRNEPTLCALVQAETESLAWSAIEQDWPELIQRFCEPVASDYKITSDRFPVADWMRARMGLTQR